MQAQQLTDRAKADSQIAHERIARAEIEADERVRRASAAIEDQLIRLNSDLAHAEHRAERAEQWLVLIRRKIEDHLMSLVRGHARLANYRRMGIMRTSAADGEPYVSPMLRV